MMQVDQRIAKAIKERGVQAVLADSLLKRDLSIMINDDHLRCARILYHQQDRG